MRLTLAQAKRDFAKGKRFLISKQNIKPERVGVVCEISKVQTNAFAYKEVLENGKLSDKEFWHWWGNSKDNIFEQEEAKKTLSVFSRFEEGKLQYEYMLF